MGSTQNSKGYIQFGGIYLIIRLKNQILNIPSISFFQELFSFRFFPMAFMQSQDLFVCKMMSKCLSASASVWRERDVYHRDGHLFVSSSFFREKKEGGKRDDWSHTKSIFCMLENRVATSSGKVVVKASFFPT